MLKKKRLTLPSLCLALVLAPTCARLTAAQSPGPRVRLDTVGYLPGRDKRATLPAPCGDFEVVNESNGRVVFKGQATARGATATPTKTSASPTSPP